MRATVNVLTMVMLFTCVTYSMADNKRGTAGSQDQRENAINARWAYNYMNEPTTFDVGPANFEFVPMIFLATTCLLYTSPSPRDGLLSRMPSSA